MMNDLLGHVMHGAAEAPGDYRVDGLLHCGKCGMPKEMILDIPFCDDKPTVCIMCSCEEKKYNDKEAQRNADEVKNRIERLRQSGIGGDYTSMTFANDDCSDERISRMAHRYVDNFNRMEEENIGLMLYGDTGCGKTFIAACIANALVDKGISAMITTAADLVSAMSSDYERNREEVFDQLENARLLVLDDIGFERKTSFMNEKLFEIIDARSRSNRPVIVTTNLDPTTVRVANSIEEKRIFDRLKAMCTPVAVTGKGRRSGIAKEKYSTAKELLGL